MACRQFPTIPYKVLCTDLSSACATLVGDKSGCAGLAVPVFKLVPAAAPLSGQQVPLVCAQRLAASSETSAVAAVDASTGLAHCYKLVSTPASQPVPKLINIVCSSARIALKGSTEVAAPPSKWQNIITRVSTAQASQQWQLQPDTTVPLLHSAWQQHQMAGHFTAAAVLLNAAGVGTQRHTQQLQQLQHILAKACSAAAPAGSIPWAASSTTSSGADALQLLLAAAAGLLAASASQDDAAQHAACAAVPEPILCSSMLYGALCATLQQQQQQQASVVASVRSRAGGVHTPAATWPAALVVAATSGGQVWLCDPLLAVQPSHQACNTQQQQQQQQQALQPVKLLLDLQQPLVDIVPASLDGGAQGLLLVGSLGRLVLLQTQHHQQQQQAVAKLTAGQQLQLPFQVVAAALVASADQTQAGAPSKQQQDQPFNSVQLLLLLLSTSGRLYAAGLSTLGLGTPQPAAAAGLGAGVQTAGAAAVSTPGLLPLQPMHIPLPAAVTRFWTVAGPNDSSSSSAHAHAGASSTSVPWAAQSHSHIIAQLGNSAQLLEMSVEDVQAAVAAAAAQRAAAQQVGVPADAGAGSSTVPAEAAREARQQLKQLVAALETLAAAKQTLEAAARQQETYLQGMQRDMDLLGLLQQQYGAKATHQQQQQGATVSQSASGTDRSSGSKGQPVRCSVLLHGLWPILGSTGAASPSSSIHLALSVQLQQVADNNQGTTGAAGRNSSSSSRRFTGRLGPGWQLVVSFVPETAHSSSLQTTVDVSSTSSSSSSSSRADGSIHASLMLPLPKGCGALQEGGWVMVYAVKQPFGPAAAHASAAANGASSWQGQQRQHVHTHGQAPAGTSAQQQQQRQQQRQQKQQGLLPVVTLLGHQYVSLLHLATLAAANPAVQPFVRASGVLQVQPVSISNSSGGSARPTYSCMLQLSAAAAAAAAAGAASDETRTEPATAGAHDGAKRPRYAAATAGAMPEAPQQQHHADSAAGQVRAQADQQQAAACHTESGVLALHQWLSRALCLNTGPTAAPPFSLHTSGQPWGAGFSTSNTLSSSVVCPSGSLQQGLGGSIDSSAVARQGQALFALTGGDVARAAWGFSTGQELPSMQLLDAAAGAGAVTAGTKRAAGNDAAGDGDSGASSSGGASLSLQLQASKVPTLASMHRAVLLEMLQQLQQGSGVGSSSTDSSTSGSGSSKGGGSGHAQAWHMVSTLPQLKLAASRLRQLHQHLLKLQGKVEHAQDLLLALEPLAPLGAAAGGRGAHTWPDDASIHANAAADAAAAGGREGISAYAATVRELSVLLQQLKQGVCAGYGRFLLAVSDAVQLEVAGP